jgi:hypothetical protein
MHFLGVVKVIFSSLNDGYFFREEKREQKGSGNIYQKML